MAGRRTEIGIAKATSHQVIIAEAAAEAEIEVEAEVEVDTCEETGLHTMEDPQAEKSFWRGSSQRW